MKKFFSIILILSVLISVYITQSKSVLAYTNVTDYFFYDNQYYIFNSNNGTTNIFSADNTDNIIFSVKGNGVGVYLYYDTIFCVVSTSMNENTIYTYSFTTQVQNSISITDLDIDYDRLGNFTPISQNTFAYVKNNTSEVIIYNMENNSSKSINIASGINSIISDGELLLIKENTSLHCTNLETYETKKYQNFSSSGKVLYLTENICIIGNNVYYYDSDNIEYLIKIDDNAVKTDNGYAFFKNNIVYITDENYNVIHELEMNFNICSIIYNGLLYILTTDNIKYYTEYFDLYNISDNPITEPDNSSTVTNTSSINNSSSKNNTQDSSNNTQSNTHISQNYNNNNNNNIFIDRLYSINKNYITNIPQGTTIAAFKKSINSNYQLSVINHNNKSVTSGKIGTGFTFTFNNKNTNQKYIYYTIIYGDITGEGNINSNDINTLMSYLLNETVLSDCSIISADMDQNGSINNKDLLLISQKTN